MGVELASLDEQVQREHAVYLQVEGHILESEIKPRVTREIIEEHRSRPIGKHSDELERVLIYLRMHHLEMAGKYIPRMHKAARGVPYWKVFGHTGAAGVA